jgi:hypothetical protein
MLAKRIRKKEGSLTTEPSKSWNRAVEYCLGRDTTSTFLRNNPAEDANWKNGVDSEVCFVNLDKLI